MELLTQVGLALLYYGVLVLLMRLAGKRLAGQTTTFDLLVLISLAVVLQQSTLREGPLNAVVFLATVFVAHRGQTLACARWTALRRLLRGAPRPLVRDGQVMWHALEDESMSYEELVAGLRRAGCPEPARVRLAVLEETGHISAIPLRD